MDTNGEYRKTRKITGPGKGPERRKGADDKAYREGWERIFGKTRKKRTK